MKLLRFLLLIPLAFLLTGSVTTNMLQVVAKKKAAGGGGGEPTYEVDSQGTYVTTSPATFTITAPTAANCYVLVFVMVDGTTVSSGVDWDSTGTPGAMGLLKAQDPVGSYGRVEVWGLAVGSLSGGTITISVSNGSYKLTSALIASGVHQSNTPATFSANGSGTAVSTTATGTLTDKLIVDGAVWSSSGAGESGAVGANQTEQWQVLQSGSIGILGSTQSGADGGAMTWTLDGAYDWSQVVVVMEGS